MPPTVLFYFQQLKRNIMMLIMAEERKNAINLVWGGKKGCLLDKERDRHTFQRVEGREGRKGGGKQQAIYIADIYDIRGKDHLGLTILLFVGWRDIQLVEKQILGKGGRDIYGGGKRSNTSETSE